MAKVTLQTVIKECETLKVEVEGSVLSTFELVSLEIAFLRGQQSKVQEELARLELARLEKEVA
tara:strand:+ start:163 stop:351 length:189 start_codon:yes stop_codon:yes gene_type:complete